MTCTVIINAGISFAQPSIVLDMLCPQHCLPPRALQPTSSMNTSYTDCDTWCASCNRGHTDDVQDLAWAPDSSALMSGSIENICIIWDVEAGARKCRLEDHRHYVQVRPHARITALWTGELQRTQPR